MGKAEEGLRTGGGPRGSIGIGAPPLGPKQAWSSVLYRGCICLDEVMASPPQPLSDRTPK
jgi:hypothetical protein